MTRPRLPWRSPSTSHPRTLPTFRTVDLRFPLAPHPITGHIDFLQLRAGYLHILDDKPDAAKETHAVTQLTIYAMALSRRTGLPVKAFKCAWFDERDYFEFIPCPASTRGNKQPRVHVPGPVLCSCPVSGKRLSYAAAGPTYRPWIFLPTAFSSSLPSSSRRASRENPSAASTCQIRLPWPHAAENDPMRVLSCLIVSWSQGCV